MIPCHLSILVILSVVLQPLQAAKCEFCHSHTILQQCWGVWIHPVRHLPGCFWSSHGGSLLYDISQDVSGVHMGVLSRLQRCGCQCLSISPLYYFYTCDWWTCQATALTYSPFAFFWYSSGLENVFSHALNRAGSNSCWQQQKTQINLAMLEMLTFRFFCVAFYVAFGHCDHNVCLSLQVSGFQIPLSECVIFCQQLM